MKKRIIGLVCLCAAAVGAVGQLPLAWIGQHIIPDVMGSDIRYSGTIWEGHISGVDGIGDLHFRLSPKVALSGGLPIKFQTSSSAMILSGKASHKRIKDLRFSGPLTAIPTRDGRLQNLAGNFDVQLSDLHFNKACVSAKGRVNTDLLNRNHNRWQWRGPILSGPIICEDGDFIVKLLGSENAQIIQADLRLAVDGQYRADFSVRTAQPEAAIVLPLYGFEKKDGEFHLTEQGKWR